MIQITLTAYNMGCDATAADFDRWASYVAQHISEALSLAEVEVDQFEFEGGPERDLVHGGTEEQRAEVRRWLAHEGWEAWCGSETAQDAA